MADININLVDSEVKINGAYFCRILANMEEFRLLAPLKRDFLL